MSETSLRSHLKHYGVYGCVRLIVEWLISSLFFYPARLVRLPIYIRGRSAIKWGQGFTIGEITGARVKLNNRGNVNPIKLRLVGRLIMVYYVHQIFRSS